MIIEIKVPEPGEGVTEITIVEWHKKVNDTVDKGELLVEIMTDKVNQEMVSPVSGKVAEILYDVDEVARVGETMVRIEQVA